MGWLIALGILILLAILPLGVTVRYDYSGILLKAIAGPFRITLLPTKKKKDKPPKEKKKEKASSNGSRGEQQETQPKPKGGSLLDFLPLVKLAVELRGDFGRKLRVKRLEMKMIMAGGDPCDLAISYGKAWAALGNIMPHLENIFVIKKRDLQVECDFTADQTTIYVGADVTITLGWLLVLVVRYGIRGLREFLKIQNKRKGGAS